MPGATNELRNKMQEYFGDPIDEHGPMRFLESKGHRIGKDWMYRKEGYSWKQLTQKERDCIDFLCDEWDFGGYDG